MEQPDMTSFLHLCRGRSRNSATPDRRPTQFVSAGACVCKATDHVHAGWGPLVREQSRSDASEMQPSAAVLQEATRVCRPCFSGTRA
jgi:hypothetical protein